MIHNTKQLLLGWNDAAWNQYVSYLYIDKKYIRKINRLIKSIQRDGHRKGIGNPEPLKKVINPKGVETWSRRITRGYRLVYVVKKI